MKVAVIGSGTMGSGIAQVAATSDCQVKLFDLNNEALIKSKISLEKVLDRLVEKQKINDAEKNRIQNNISYVNTLNDLSDFRFSNRSHS